jgi:RimJ/RimL family protein N-acetyltransferase
MTWHLTDDLDEFARTAGDFLRSRPVEHTVPLTLVDTLRTRGRHFYGPDDPIFGWWQDPDGSVSGAYLQTPPFPLLVTAAPAVPELVDLLADRPLPGVNALSGDSEAFAERWRERSGARCTVRMRSRLFRLDRLTPPTPMPPGAPRVAGAGDRDLLVSWMEAFHGDIGEKAAHRDLAELIDDKLSYDGMTLWEVDGVPVSMAGATRLEAGMVRVMAVYTPKPLRGRGYAGAVTSVVSQAALDAGADKVVLYTDLANPTSNALYQRLGYRPVEDRTVVEFSA